MENKYYTPSIEEFFVGFECEWQSKIRQESWNKQICDVDLINIAYDSFEHSDIEEPFNEQFRVKYLDSSDIEELGFTVVKTKGNSFEAVKKFTFTYDNYPSEGEYNIIVSGDKYCVIKLKDIGETTLFRGEIKNKNVLKQVLKMLDIK